MIAFDSQHQLSKAGEQRRVEILDRAIKSVRQRRRRRIAINVVASAAVIVLVASIGMGWLQRSAVVAPVAVLKATAPSTKPVVAGRIREGTAIQWIETDPHLLERITIAPPQRRAFEVIDDDQLLQALSDAGQPGGLVEVGNHRYVIAATAPGEFSLLGSTE